MRPTRLLLLGKLGIAAFALLTIFITWRAKFLEMSIESHSSELALIEKAAPDFSLRSLDGRKISLAEFRGRKTIVLNFWASWCGPCRLEMPWLKAFYQQHHTANSDFEVLAISIDEDPAAAESFVTENKPGFPVLLDNDRQVATAYGVDGIPVTLVISQDGKVIDGQVGYDMTMDFRLSRWLGIPKSKAGGTDNGIVGH